MKRIIRTYILESRQYEVLDTVVLPKSITDEPIEIELYSLQKNERQTSYVSKATEPTAVTQIKAVRY